MANFFKRLLLALLSLMSPGLGNRGAILMYHSVDRNNLFFTVMPEEFDRQMKYLKDKRYKVIPLSEMIVRLKEGESVAKCVSITFDDGYSDFIKHAFPVLRRYGFPATVFLITGELGKTRSPKGSKTALTIMSESDVRHIGAATELIEFMPHTVSHPDLDAISLEDAKREIDDSRRAVELLTKKPADVLAYPRGRHTAEVVAHLRASGEWLGAVTADTGLVHTGDSLFLLKRIPVDSATKFSIFKKKLSGAIELYEKAKRK